MKSIILLLCVLLMGYKTCFAQQTLPEFHYKRAAIVTVCKNIAAARADIRKMPIVEVYSRSSSKQVVAQFKAQPTPTVFVDEKLYDLCTTFGKDSLHALACILGHELAHYYENHTWINSFAALTSGNASSENSIEEKAHIEAAADYFGLFYGFLAGYETYNLLPRVLDAIYTEYNLPQQLPGYPTKTERITISKTKVEEFMPLVYMFKAGQLLYLRKKFEEAALCYEYILAKFPSKEIYNNAGVAKLSRVAELLGKEELYFAYPFELDAKTRLSKSSVRTGIEDQNTIKLLLQEAKGYFEKAITSDKLYAPAYINLACVYSLQNNQEAALGKINELEQGYAESNTPLPANAYLLRGITLVKNDQVEKAQESFEKAVSQKAFMADYNYSLYKKLHSDWKNALSEWITHWPKVEKWINAYWADSKDKQRKAVKETLPSQFFSHTAISNNQDILISSQQHPVKITVMGFTDEYMALRIQTEEYTLETATFNNLYKSKTKAGIAVGDKPNELLKQYGQASSQMAGAHQTQFYVYDSLNIIFEANAERVKGWSVYQVVY